MIQSQTLWDRLFVHCHRDFVGYRRALPETAVERKNILQMQRVQMFCDSAPEAEQDLDSAPEARRPTGITTCVPEVMVCNILKLQRISLSIVLLNGPSRSYYHTLYIFRQRVLVRRVPQSMSQSGRVLVPIEVAFKRFEEIVSDTDNSEFHATELKDVYEAAMDIQIWQCERRDLKNMRRIKPLIASLRLYAGPLETLCQGTPYLHWFWVT